MGCILIGGASGLSAAGGGKFTTRAMPLTESISESTRKNTASMARSAER